MLITHLQLLKLVVHIIVSSPEPLQRFRCLCALAFRKEILGSIWHPDEEKNEQDGDSKAHEVQKHVVARGTNRVSVQYADVETHLIKPDKSVGRMSMERKGSWHW